MTVFPGMGLKDIEELTLVQYAALQAMATKIVEAKSKAMSL